MHIFHKYRKWEYHTTIEWYLDGSYTHDRELWLTQCEVCGHPKRKYIKL